VDALEPDRAMIGSAIELHGANLRATREMLVMFHGGVAGRLLAADSEGAWIRVVVPVRATTGEVHVRLDRTDVPGPVFTVIEGSPAPGIEQVSPDNVMFGAPATSVHLYGWSFVATSRLLLDDAPIEPTAIADNRIDVLLPASLLATPARHWFQVENPPPGGGTSERVAFQVSRPFNVVEAIPTGETSVRVVFDQPVDQERASRRLLYRLECFS
jgi:hypothetical protein